MELKIRAGDELHDYLTFEDLKKRKGYRVYSPKVGALGKALSLASKQNKAASWLKKQLDRFYAKLGGIKCNHKNAKRRIPS